jgi:hypothetical protein
MIEYLNHLIVFLSDLNRSVRPLLSQISQKFVCFFWLGLLAPRPTPNLEDQSSVFMCPGGRVAQLYT